MTPRASQSVRSAAGALALATLGGCASAQPLLDPGGPVAEAITELGIWAIATGGAVAGIVIVLMLIPVLRARRFRHPDEIEPMKLPGRELTWALVAGGAIPAVVLAAFYVFNLQTLSAITRAPTEPELTIDIVGHQWWWEVRYPHADPARFVETANEIHIPVGQPVRFRVRSSDVIHSFWVPQLGRKIDLIPGRVNTIWLQADAPGIYYGQCAEFCGAQHARMRLRVIAEPPARFSAWYEHQLQPARPPTDSLQLAGRETFIASPCVLCHTVRGTPAAGSVGPDLTHIGSRHTIGAGLLPNTVGNLEAWIVDAQHLKPGVHMPSYNVFAGERLRALAAYLHGLK